MAKRLKNFTRVVKEHELISAIASFLPSLNFITIHYYYFIATCMIFSLIFWGTSNPSKSVTYTDSLFLVVSAMTEAGLNTVNLSEITTFQQFLLWILLLLGSSIFVSISTLLTRKRVFENRFKHVVKLQKTRRARRSSAGGEERLVPHTARQIGITPGEETRDTQSTGQVHQNNETPCSTATPASGIRSLTFVEAAAGQSYSTANGSRVLSPAGIYNRTSRPEPDDQDNEDRVDLAQSRYPDYLTRHTTGRNSQFFGLSKAEREHLGGVEYQAITMLAWVVPIYFASWQILGCVGLGAYMANNKAALIQENGINAWWLGVFNGVSAFNNSGMSLLDLNMIPFRTSPYVMITMGLLILAGNTAYPLFLRLILWTAFKMLSLIFPNPEHYTDYKATLRFILKYPRRVYTNLFPAAPTRWLLFMVVVLNGTDWVAFELLNIGNPSTVVIPTKYRVLDGLFQAIAVRSGGFYIISIPSLRIGLQVLYVIMMYISVYPVVITMRHSNVYEERSLGIYANENEAFDEEAPSSTKPGTLLRRTIKLSLSPFPATNPIPQTNAGTNFVRQQIRGQLAHDLWWLAGAVLLISCIEVSNFDRDPVTYSVFNIMFEVVSGYGCVGISPGLPNKAYSFSGGWHICSKLVLCAVMIRGRHRGLPVSLDRAVRLPGLEPGLTEEEDHMVRQMSNSIGHRPETASGGRPAAIGGSSLKHG